MARWDGQGPTMLAWDGPRRPFDVPIREYAAARGIPTLRVRPPRPTRVPARVAGNRWS